MSIIIVENNNEGSINNNNNIYLSSERIRISEQKNKK
jgi:hypothetical protein